MTTASPAPPGVFTALVLAGSRDSVDAFAESAGCRYKALVPVAGVPMLIRVVRALRAARGVGRILVAFDDRSALAAEPELRTLLETQAVLPVPCATSPSTSVFETMERFPDARPLLVTTADHALLTADMVDHFCSAAFGSDADVLVALVTERLLRERYPGSRRTIVRFRGEGVSGANLFGFLTNEARVVAEFWKRAERLRKRPWRLAGLFGWMNLLLFVTRGLDLETAFARASRRIGASIKPLRLPFAEAAIDVDKQVDLTLASQILRERGDAAPRS